MFESIERGTLRLLFSVGYFSKCTFIHDVTNNIHLEAIALKFSLIRFFFLFLIIIFRNKMKCNTVFFLCFAV